MGTGRILVVAAGLSLMLAGCVTEGGSYGTYGASPSYGYGEPYGYGYGAGPGYGYGPAYGYGRGGYYDRGPSRPYGYDEPRRMSGRAMAALAEGCRQRFYPGTSKFDQCISGNRKSADSLVEGCTRLYRGDPEAYGRCLRGR